MVISSRCLWQSSEWFFPLTITVTVRGCFIETLQRYPCRDIFKNRMKRTLQCLRVH